MSFKSLLQEPLLPEGCVDSSCNCSDGQKLLPGVSFRVVRFLSWCQIVLCSAGIVFLLLDWHQPCPTHSSSTHSSAGRLINWRPMLGRKAGLAGLGAHLSCIRGPSQSLVLTLNAAKACLLVLDVAGLALAVSLLQLCRAKRSHWGPAASKQEGGQTRHSPVSDLETIDSSKASYAEGNGSSCHCVDALQCSCVEWRKCRHRQQLLEQSLTFSLRVWLAMLTTAGLVASLWL